MKKLLLVARQEVWYHLGQWTFYLTILIMPLVFAALGALPRLQSAAEEAPLPEVETILDVSSPDIETVVGYVDQADIVATVPDYNADNFIEFSNTTMAARALERDEIEGYYVIAPDFIDSGRVTYFSPTAQLLTDTDSALQALLRQNLLTILDDPLLAARLDDPVQLLREGPPPPQFRFLPTDFDLGQLVSAGLVVGLFVYVINVGGNLLLRALQREVRARVLEMMIVNTTPAQFIGGKLLGLSTLTLAQAGLTLLAGVLVYGQNPDSSGPAALPLAALALSAPYLVLGFLAYCGAIMAVAATWPDFRESGALLGGLRLLSLAPLIGTLFILPDPEGVISLGLSLCPLTAHLLMPFRLLLEPVPGWQWTVGLLGLTGWAGLWVWLSMRLFRAQGLLTGRSVSAKLVWQSLWQ